MTERATKPNRPAQRPAAGRRLPSGDRRYTWIKRALVVALLVYTWLVVSANGARNVDFGIIEARMAAAKGVNALFAGDENAFQERFGLSPEGCEDWLLYGSDAVMDVSELMIAKAGEDVLSRLEEAVRQRLENQLNIFKSYGPEQADLLERAVVLRRGGYLFYGVGEDAAQWEDTFLSCVR